MMETRAISFHMGCLIVVCMNLEGFERSGVLLNSISWFHLQGRHVSSSFLCTICSSKGAFKGTLELLKGSKGIGSTWVQHLVRMVVGPSTSCSTLYVS